MTAPTNALRCPKTGRRSDLERWPGLIAASNPRAHRSLIWFTVWSSVVHAGTMAAQSMPAEHHGHLIGDVPALFLVAILLGGLLAWSDRAQADAA